METTTTSRCLRQMQMNTKISLFSFKKRIVIKMFNCVPTIRAWTLNTEHSLRDSCQFGWHHPHWRRSHHRGMVDFQSNHIIYSHSKLCRRLLAATTMAVQMLCFSFDIFNSINYVNFLPTIEKRSLVPPTQTHKKCTAFILVHNKFNELTVAPKRATWRVEKKNENEEKSLKKSN